MNQTDLKAAQGRYNLSGERVLFLIILLALVVRVLYTIFTYRSEGTSTFMDDWDYADFAKLMLQEGIFTKTFTTETIVLGPSWPLMIAGCFALFGEQFWPVFIINIVFSTLSVYFIYSIARHLYNRQVALLSALWAALYVPFFNFNPSLLKENFNQFFFVLCLYLILKYVKDKRTFSWLGVITVISYSIFIHGDERYFFYFPLVLLFLWRGSEDARLGFKKAMVFTGMLVITMIPWLYRNYILFERPVILTVRTNFLIDKIFGYEKLTLEEKNTPYKRKNLPLYEQASDSLRKGVFHDPGIPKHYIYGMQTAMERGIEIRTYSRWENYWMEFKELWRPVRFRPEMIANGYRYEKEWYWYSNLIYGLSFGLLLPFMVFALVYQVRKRDKRFLITLAILMFHTILHVFFAHVRIRYRYPIDALVIISGIYGLWLIVDYLKPDLKLKEA